MIPGIAPVISKKKAADPGGGYSFTMTAGYFPDFQVTGYSTNLSIGEIDNDPFAPNTITGFAESPLFASLNFGITGDVRSQLSGKNLYIDNVMYMDGFSGYSLNGPETLGSWDVYGLIEGLQYFIEIK